MIIAFFALYYAKKYFSFLPINRAKIYMKNYLIGVGVFFTVFFAYAYYMDNQTIVDYAKYNQAKQHNPDVYEWDYKKHNPNVEIMTGTIIIGGLVTTAIAVILLLLVFNKLFFNPLEEHKDWIIKNGIFSGKKDKLKIIGRDNLSSYSVADEILKWNNLFEKGIISKEEFENIKTKMMNGEKV